MTVYNEKHYFDIEKEVCFFSIYEEHLNRIATRFLCTVKACRLAEKTQKNVQSFRMREQNVKCFKVLPAQLNYASPSKPGCMLCKPFCKRKCTRPK